MAPVYEAVCAEQGWEVDGAQLARMREANAKRLQELEERVKDAGGWAQPLALYREDCGMAGGSPQTGASPC